MKYFTDGNNIYAYELDGSQDAYIREGLTPITEAQANDMRAAKEQAVISQLTYAQKRQAEYPSVAEQLDMLFHGGVDGWREQIQAIKDKYPK